MKERQYKIIVENIRTDVDEPDAAIYREAAMRIKRAGIFCDESDLHLRKRSIDARHKNKILFVSSVFAICTNTTVFPDRSVLSRYGIRIDAVSEPEFKVGTEVPVERPVVIGFGPAGIFASIALAEHGLPPVILEKGYDIDRRIADVDRFIKTGALDVNSNVQFGAGGAGTFSDGKLTCRIGDSRCDYVIDLLHKLGAPEDIKWKAKPHIGTDCLRNIVRRADEYLRSLGAEIHYGCTVDKVGDGFVKANNEVYPACAVVLSAGHSARDLYFSLMRDGYHVQAKPFSVGVRIEHLQSDIDEAMFGNPELYTRLGHAEYNLSYKSGNRGVYSFCMCPGGYVMASASEEGGIVTNGMSMHDRSGRNANAAIAVSVLPEDFGGSPAAAIEFQRNIEHTAFNAEGCYKAPAQKVGDFISGCRSSNLTGKILPTYMEGEVVPFDMKLIFPSFVTEMLHTGILNFGQKIQGFDCPEAILTGPETRTSAPVRIIRGDNLIALGKDRVYPCGEGAGYAGGIVSAAVDGIRVAQEILTRFAPISH